MAARSEILNQKRTPRKSGWMRTTALAAGFAAVGGAGVYYVLSQPDAADGALLETSQSAAIQPNDRSGVMVPDLGEPEIEATPVADDQGELDRLRTENERLAAQIAEEQEAAAERRRLFEERLDEIEQENAEQLAAMQAQLESDYSRRQAEAAAEQAARLAAEQAEADRRRALEEERARREEELARRMQAPPVMGKTGSETFANGTVGAERQAMSGDREFLIASAAATETRRATVTANPANTVGQGTIIEAALEVAINSDLQGQVAAIVSRDVWSMDMTRVLVPRGSKLFGTYNSEMGQTQKRVLVAWTRLTTKGRTDRIAQVLWLRPPRPLRHGQRGEQSLCFPLRLGRAGQRHQRPAVAALGRWRRFVRFLERCGGKCQQQPVGSRGRCDEAVSRPETDDPRAPGIERVDPRR